MSESDAGKGDDKRPVHIPTWDKNYTSLYGSDEEVRQRRIAYIAEQKAKAEWEQGK